MTTRTRYLIVGWLGVAMLALGAYGVYHETFEYHTLLDSLVWLGLSVALPISIGGIVSVLGFVRVKQHPAGRRMLFAGTPNVTFGGLSNEEELVGACPRRFFRESNPWHQLAFRIWVSSLDPSDWEWRSSDERERDHQLACLSSFLATFGVSQEQKKAVAAWMLSRMLVKVPA